MKTKLSSLSARYLAALRKHLKHGSHASLKPASGLGRQAAALGLDTLQLARIHEQALAALDLSNSKNGVAGRAATFFTEAHTPIEETHQDSRQSKADVSQLKHKLGRRTEELATSHRQLKQGVARRKVMKHAAEKTGKDHKKCLEESLQLQKRLRQLTHRILTAHEDERKKISLELQDEIGQTLMGINIRLLSLKQEARTSTKVLKGKIASTQRLVVKSARSVSRVAQKFGKV
jgi:signal transduction histidine kinase